MSLDVRPDHLKIVLNILNKYVPDREVWAFGSRATGNARETSDLDLVIIGETPLEFETLAALRDAFSESKIPYRVDVVDWATTSESFRKIIQQEKMVVLNVKNKFGLTCEWREIPFNLAVTINPKVQLLRGRTYPFVDMASVNANSRCVHASEERPFNGGGSRFAVGDTLMARITPCLENGKIARFCCKQRVVGHGSTEFIVIRGRSDITETEYVYYLTQWERVREYAISQMSGTSGRQRVPTEALGHIDVPIPPLSEQRAIAHILGTLDDKIELNRRMNETLEAMAQALFKSWFVDFDPVRAKMEGRETGLPKEIEDLFPDSFEDSELGEIPRGWRATNLASVIGIWDSQRIPLSSRERADRKGKYPYYGATGVIDYVDEFLFNGTYILVGEDGSVINEDQTPITQYVWGQFWVSNHAHVLTGKNGISNEHLLLFLRQTNIGAFVTGAVQLKLSQGNLNRIPFLLPNTLLCERFGILVEPLFEKLRENIEEIACLTAFRDSILPKLLSGDIRVHAYSSNS